MNKRVLIEQKAREWLDTPWMHHQRCKGAGVDCVQLLAAVAEECGIKYGNIENYYRTPRGDSLLEELRKRFQEISITETDVGDILVFRVAGIPWHCGLKSSRGVIHASMAQGRVVEHGLSSGWKRKISAAFSVIENG